MFIDFNQGSKSPDQPGAVSLNLWVLIAAALIMIGAAYYVGAYTNARTTIDQSLAQLGIFPKVVKNYVAGWLSTPKRMIIDIKQKNFDIIKYKRYEAIQRNLITTDEDSYVPAKINVDGKSYKVDLRLKGDYTDHLEGDKWSFRIKVKGENTIWGMKRFSIQSPERSGYIKEYIFHRFLKYEGLIGLRYDFIEVVLNGKNLGIFALEESFSKELIESNDRREGPILKFDESGYLVAFLNKELTDEQKEKIESNYYLTSDILSFRTEQTLADETQRQNFFNGRSLLSKLRNREISLSEAMDVKRAARAVSILTIISAYHAVRWKNVRFYFNPVTQKLELIAYNAYAPGLGIRPYGASLYEIWLIGSQVTPEWYELFFTDREFLQHYFSELERMTSPGYLEKFFDTILPDLEEKQAILFRDGPLHLPPLDVYFYNRNQIVNQLNFQPKLRAWLNRDNSSDDSLNINVAANAPLPMQLNYIKCKHTGNVYPVDTFIHGSYHLQPLKLIQVSIQGLQQEDLDACVESEVAGAADNLVLDGMELQYSVLGFSKNQKAAIDAWSISMARETVPANEEMLAKLQDYHKLGLLNIDEKNHVITLPPRTWQLEETLYVPPGYTLAGNAGTVLILNKDAALVSFSPVRFSGNEAKPFVITSSDGTGQGLLVMSAQADSILENVRIYNVKNINRDGWTLTGAVTFYESAVDIRNSVIESINAEDALNIIRSRFSIDRSIFRTTSSDAIDIDFGKGEISNSIFADCTNDCIDVSGTEINITNVSITRTSDKGISVGEKSTANISNVKISMANIGIASKDTSDTRLDAITITGSGTGLAAYRKKPEFSGGKITGKKVVIDSTETPLQQDELSVIEIQ